MGLENRRQNLLPIQRLDDSLGVVAQAETNEIKMMMTMGFDLKIFDTHYAFTVAMAPVKRQGNGAKQRRSSLGRGIRGIIPFRERN